MGEIRVLGGGMLLRRSWSCQLPQQKRLQASALQEARGGHCCEMREIHNSISNFETMPHNWDVINLKGTGALRNVVEIFDQ